MLDRPLIINLAPTGAVADAAKNPAVPITAERIVDTVAACATLGASIVHLHVRHADGSPSCDPRDFEAVLGPLRAMPETRGLVMCATTSGRHGQTLDQRTAVLELPADLRPDMASLTLGSVNFATGASINLPDDIRRLTDRMNDAGVKPELEVFDLGMIEFAKVLIREGRLKPPYYVNLLLGNISGLQATPLHLGTALAALPDGAIISTGGIGRHQLTATTLGAVSCDGVRIGLEDNLWADANRTPATNEGAVQRIRDLCVTLGRPVATAVETRAKLGLRAALER